MTDAEYEGGEEDGVGGEPPHHRGVACGLLDEAWAVPSQSQGVAGVGEEAGDQLATVLVT